MQHDLELAEHYQKYFYTVSANTPELKRLAYHLRYKVFIEERGYRIGNCNSVDKTEQDEYDEHSLHGLIFHRPTNRAIGYIRLIPINLKGAKILPIEKCGKILFNHDVLSKTQLRSPKIGEISRMCLLNSFRQRRFDKIYLSGTTCEVEEINSDRRFPINYLALCLSLISINLLFHADLSYSLAMMEKPLAGLIRHYGIQYEQVGPYTDYCGRRAPFLIYPQATYDNLLPGIIKLYKIIRAELNCDAMAIT